ncbi:hypothetical protein [Jongsikchunia kroppenstedtii]|uniref:hypothetical protein n=1 Tax=Jongsikchunia kroppenstedtii TaxID=1121721 RepID=UPI00035FB11D|nr:hypothetical protein [Jongsikchunia kroppenstedtii]
MWWKIALAVVALWVAFGIIGALLKGVATFIVLVLVVVGTVALVKWIVSSDRPKTKI